MRQASDQVKCHFFFEKEMSSHEDDVIAEGIWLAFEPNDGKKR